MTAQLTLLLNTIDQLKAQHRAGITPQYGQLEDLFESAAAVRSDLAAIAAGMTPPPPQRVSGALVLEHVDCAPIRMTLEVGQAARAMFEGLRTAVR